MSYLEILNENEETTLGKSHFGYLRLFATKVKRFAKGATYSLPGVKAGRFDIEKGRVDNDGNLTCGMLKDPAGDGTHFVLALQMEAQDGAKYWQTKKHNGWKGNDPIHYWVEMVRPALYEAFTVQEREQMLSQNINNTITGTGFYVQVEEVPTGGTFENKPVTYWRVANKFASENEMKTARDTFFAQFQQQATPANSNYPDPPELWLNDPKAWQDTVDEIRSVHTNGAPLPILLSKYNKVNYDIDESLLRQIIDIPF